ncbi:YjcQ family protein [Siminovitchia sp. 179-K 8D1 HS]|uniref:YjcQ family protein n=1 Tax=Siminovitchia sp. 179-K 8D1 HS TaxID=3142385 RepID=UPI0039A25CA5
MNEEKIRIVILKESRPGGLLEYTNEDLFDSEILGFSWKKFVDQVNYLYANEYITKPPYGDGTIPEYASSVTEKGEEYLKNSRWINKLYKTAKEIRDWIK